MGGFAHDGIDHYQWFQQARTPSRRSVCQFAQLDRARYYRAGVSYSHSIVPGGLLVTSYTTRFTPFTSLMMRVATWPMNFMSNG
jgi:hypothetical protein